MNQRVTTTPSLFRSTYPYRTFKMFTKCSYSFSLLRSYLMVSIFATSLFSLIPKSDCTQNESTRYTFRRNEHDRGVHGSTTSYSHLGTPQYEIIRREYRLRFFKKGNSHFEHQCCYFPTSPKWLHDPIWLTFLVNKLFLRPASMYKYSCQRLEPARTDG